MTAGVRDPRRFSAIAHDGILLWNPLPLEATLRVADGLALSANARVIDVGCGRAELLLRILERTGARGVGVDEWPHAMTSARSAAAGRVGPDRLELRQEPFDGAQFGDGSFDAALCIGSTHAFGDGRPPIVPALRALHRLLVPGGIALVGEGHWLREPDPDYLAFLGADEGDLLDHEGNLRLARESGFVVTEAIVSSHEDFDVYENRYATNVERFVADHPDDPDADAFARRIRAWRAAYLRWGRETLGFALYVLRRR